MQKAVKKYATIYLWKFGAESPTSPLLPQWKDPLEDLITSASAATRSDSSQAARTLATYAHQQHFFYVSLACALAHTWAQSQLAHQLPPDCANSRLSTALGFDSLYSSRQEHLSYHMLSALSSSACATGVDIKPLIC
ncbi:hypothetical protein F511_27590 [Dorcoceras hygrometricum]|uniref:Uncharacterized protein n=1 Tax=Dorcoceras hygrometricum TaxID=472368 RepID=A0A2Z7ASN2_9LAMI|nr:hypothetical protein F511_27590 [Dorcoceras hygrometricum]